MSLRFFRRIPLTRFLTMNLSKGGASASVGFPGFHVTSGTSGSRVTVGIPGTGLFYTHHLNAAELGARNVKAATVHDFVLGLGATSSNPAATPADYAAALNRLRELGLDDSDLPPGLLTMVNDARARLRDVYGYRVVKTPPPARPVQVSLSPMTPLWIFGGLIVAAAAWALLLAWTTPQ
jgi:hypothetical protein